MKSLIIKIKDRVVALVRNSIFRYCCFFLLSILWLEAILRLWTVSDFWNSNVFIILCLSLPIALVCVLLSSLWPGRINRIISVILLGLITVLIMVQVVYYYIFGAYFTLYSLNGAGKALTFWQAALNGVRSSFLPLFLCLAPLLFWSFQAKKWVPVKRIALNKILGLVLMIGLTQIGIFSAISSIDNGVMSRGYLYNNAFIPTLSVSNFGCLTTYRLDLKNLTIGMEDTALAAETYEPAEEDSVYDDNVLEIDFDSLIASETNSVIKDMHEYFSSVTPTKQNEYTGKYEGKNLIWICAEGFSSWALDEAKTPILYKMAHEGYVFKNFYNPIWGVSTSDGEYTTCTGLIPKAGVWSFYQSGSNYMPFCLGNQLKAIGYSTRAYHDHSYSYYRRDVSHPNMGYDYKGVGNGLNMTSSWPESDVEMMQLTVPEYINDANFHTYYMTVSGHLEYNFGGNAMAMKHQSEVADLPYSEACKAYIACNMELDQAVANLMVQLEAAGKLDDTLIVISGDHYPYGLEIEEIEELNGGPVDATFELYHSTLIMWDNTMTEPVYVEKPCCSLDILPTLSNLFGLPYDSRLLMGRDIFSDSEGLVVFSDHSWLSEKGSYNADTNTFTAASGTEVSQDYAANMMALVNNMFTYSARILENDYYAKVITPQLLVSASPAEESEEEPKIKDEEETEGDSSLKEDDLNKQVFSSQVKNGE